MTEVDILERYARTIEGGHRARLLLKKQVQAHQAATSKLSAAELQLKAAKQQAVNQLQSHMHALQRKLRRRYQQALHALNHEYQLQQLPIHTTGQLLSNSITALEQSVIAIHTTIQQHSTASQSVENFSHTMQQIYSTMLRAQAAVDQSEAAAAAVAGGVGQQGFSSVQQFLQLKLTSQQLMHNKLLREGSHHYEATAQVSCIRSCAAEDVKQHEVWMKRLQASDSSRSSSSSRVTSSDCSDSFSDSSNDWLNGTAEGPYASEPNQNSLLRGLQHAAAQQSCCVSTLNNIRQHKQQRPDVQQQDSRQACSQQQWQHTGVSYPPRRQQRHQGQQLHVNSKHAMLDYSWRTAPAPKSYHPRTAAAAAAADCIRQQQHQQQQGSRSLQHTSQVNHRHRSMYTAAAGSTSTCGAHHNEVTAAIQTAAMIVGRAPDPLISSKQAMQAYDSATSVSPSSIETARPHDDSARASAGGSSRAKVGKLNCQSEASIDDSWCMWRHHAAAVLGDLVDV